MVSVAYIVSVENGLKRIEVSQDFSHGTESEKATAQMIRIVVDAVTEEFLVHAQNGIQLSRAGVAQEAARIARQALDGFQA